MFEDGQYLCVEGLPWTDDMVFAHLRPDANKPTQDQLDSAVENVACVCEEHGHQFTEREKATLAREAARANLIGA